MLKLIQKSLKKHGVHVTRWNPSHTVFLKKLLDIYGVDCILDIGAHKGGSGIEFREMEFSGDIISFEPISFLYSQLEAAAKGDAKWKTRNCAIGNTDGRDIINVAGSHHASSSILQIESIVLENDPEFKTIKKEEIQIRRLDSIIGEIYPTGDRLFLKIDVQGYEKNALEGAAETLKRVVGIKIEMSVVANYAGEMLMCDMLQYLGKMGFYLAHIENGYANHATRQLYQVDAVLIKPSRVLKA
jgi:FkbM family methyltransferase